MEQIDCTVVTGSQIVEDTADFVPYDFRVSEVTAHVAGARHYYPDCKAILDVGGQDSKAMVFNDRMKMWNYKMSGICACRHRRFSGQRRGEAECAGRRDGRPRQLRQQS